MTWIVATLTAFAFMLIMLGWLVHRAPVEPFDQELMERYRESIELVGANLNGDNREKQCDQ